jgi:hypothetical protein
MVKGALSLDDANSNTRMVTYDDVLEILRNI